MRFSTVLATSLLFVTACNQAAPEGEPGVPRVAAANQLFTGPTNLETEGELVLLADGRALATAMVSAGTYEAATNAWTPTGTFTQRYGYTLVRLKDGRVLVAGGYDPEGKTAAIYDPSTNAWTATPTMPASRSRAPAAVLPDGRVLFTTSRQPDLSWAPDADLFDPVSFTWTPTTGASTTACVDGDAFELPDGRFFFACDWRGEYYTPSTGTFTAVTGFTHTYDVAVQLADGRILLAGGYGAACQILDPSTNQLLPTGSMLSPARHEAAATLMSDGTVLVAGGHDGTATLDSVERFDPATGSWSPATPLLQKREGAHMVLLPTGDALVVGGSYRLTPTSWATIPKDRQAELLQGSCTPATCESAGASCGALDDGCGGALDCGACGEGEVCSPAHACCVPTTCAGVGCGALSDGCGGSLDCGSCGAGETCTGNVCVCAPTTCAAQGVACGVIDDGCGSTLTCNACPSGLVCDLSTATCKTPPDQAAYGATLRVPECTGETNACDSGTLLTGRAALGPEPHAPNTLGAACADGSYGTFHVDESLDRLRVVSVNGSPFATGGTVRVEATVWAYSGYTSDKLDLYYAGDAQNPSWVYLTTLTPTGAGARVLSATYVLPSGTRQVVRGVFRYGGTAGTCVAGSYTDRDDLVFPVTSAPDTTPPSVTITAPAAGATVSGSAVVLSANATDDLGVARVDFEIAPNVAGSSRTLVGSDSVAPYSVSWNSLTAPPASSYVLYVTAKDAAGNQATDLRVVVADNVGPAVSITSPADGAAVAGTVSLTADAVDYSGISQVTFKVDGVVVGTDATAPFSVSWNAASAAAGSHTILATATDKAGNSTTSLPVTVTTAAAPGTAIYSSTWRAPECSAVQATCDSGPTLLLGRAQLGPEPNASNTVFASCADGTSGTFHSDESIDRLAISTVDGGLLRAGAQVQVRATLWVYSTTDVLDVYVSPSAASPAWTFVGTATPTASGAQVLTVPFTLPAGTTQAVRAVFRWGGTRASCTTGAYDDKDDLVFAAQ